MSKREDEREVGQIQLGKSTFLKVTTYTREGTRFVNIRKYVTTGKYTGFTRQGFVITVDQLKQLKQIIDSIE